MPDVLLSLARSRAAKDVPAAMSISWSNSPSRSAFSDHTIFPDQPWFTTSK
jgi:hypothetical protein